MPQIMILCPVARRLIPTNRSIREDAFAHADLGVNTTGPCPYCGERHTWTAAEAHLPGSFARDWGAPTLHEAGAPRR